MRDLWQNTGAPEGIPLMNISTRQFENASIVDVTGDITLYNTPEVRKILLDLLKEKRVKRVIVNLEKVKYIDSAGVASLVEGLKLSRDLKSGFALFGLSRTTREVLELTRLLKVFEVHDTEEEALSGDPWRRRRRQVAPSRSIPVCHSLNSIGEATIRWHGLYGEPRAARLAAPRRQYSSSLSGDKTSAGPALCIRQCRSAWKRFPSFL